MQENKKDYEDYFRAIEKDISKEFDKNYSQKTNSNLEKSIPKGKERRKINVKAVLIFALAIFFTVLIIISIVKLISAFQAKEPTVKKETKIVKTEEQEQKETIEDFLLSFSGKEETVDSSVNSKSVIFVDDESGNVIASRNPQKRMFPASTTKIMTLLVAVENITDFDNTFTMTYTITDPLYRAGATVAGFSSGEVLNMYDLIYGTILPSGGDAAIALAEKIAGSEKNFVNLMNEKVKELGLKDTHFSNCTGLYDINNYTTCEDLAVILRAAMRNNLCKTVLAKQEYTTSKTKQHPDGILLQNTLFKYMYGTEPKGATIVGGKTGFINESGYCIASFGENNYGKTFVCITLSGDSRWPAVYDQINLYTKYAK
ncbi:MAG: serine hydrolase [Clostridia bacterium]|nr:serine hydrolase [Clostridia bacterium]